MTSVAVIAAHPDDEILGCGGTIVRHRQAEDDVHVLILAEGVTSRDDKRDRYVRSKELSALGDAAHKANEIVGSTSLTIFGFPDNRMDSVDLLEIVKTVESFLVEKNPSIVYTHHTGDLNIDHRCVHNAVVTACRPIPGNVVDQLLFFEVPSSTEWQVCSSETPFVPSWFVDIGGTLHTKREALKAYASEMREWPHPRSLDAVTQLARWRGATVGVEAAEAFILGRMIRRKLEL